VTHFLLVGRDVAVTWGLKLEELGRRKSWVTSFSSRAAPGAAQFTASDQSVSREENGFVSVAQFELV